MSFTATSKHLNVVLLQFQIFGQFFGTWCLYACHDPPKWPENTISSYNNCRSGSQCYAYFAEDGIFY